MCRIAGRLSPLQPVMMLLVALLVASNCLGSPLDDPKPKDSTGKKAETSKSKSKSKAKSKKSEEKPDESKPKTPDEKKAEENAKKKDAALKVAETYIVLIDKAKYGEAWDTMTPEVKKGITRRKWFDALGKTRGTYGDLQARKLNRIQMRATEVAERLDEAWIYTDFRTLDGQAASELLIVVLLKGKDWTVSSYYIGDTANFPKPPAEEKEEPKPADKK